MLSGIYPNDLRINQANDPTPICKTVSPAPVDPPLISLHRDGSSAESSPSAA